jgi:hypothetical protein
MAPIWRLSSKNNMRQENNRKTDPNLDTPSESNRDKHVNFRELEEDNSSSNKMSDQDKKRRDEWNRGIEEGKKNASQ